MTTETLQIRSASVADAPVLAWFGATTFMATYAGSVPDEALSDMSAGHSPPIG